ncbi:MAG: hypothetical protein NT150_00270 [Bacteroidetes bacterium]|nr:hypothetical protein [Bacteroidota bacterium]
MTLLKQYIHSNTAAAEVIIFGGNAVMMDQVVREFISVADANVFGALSLEEGIELLREHPTVKFVLIGGRYDEQQRKIIRKFAQENLPPAVVSEPGVNYLYNHENIIKHLQSTIHS